MYKVQIHRHDASVVVCGTPQKIRIIDQTRRSKKMAMNRASSRSAILLFTNLTFLPLSVTGFPLISLFSTGTGAGRMNRSAFRRGSAESLTAEAETAFSYQGIHESSTALTLLEHVNLNIPEHKYALPFYFDILGFGLDPRRSQNVVKGSGTVWVNCGPSQFHLPYGETAQVIPGSIGLAYQTLGPLKERLASAASKHEQPFKSYEFGMDATTGREYVKILDVYGNIFFARERRHHLEGTNFKDQPIVERGNAEHIALFGADFVNQYGRSSSSECLGIDYVEFCVPRSNDVILNIAQFYEFALDAAVAVSQIGTDRVAIIGFGNIQDGHSSQCLLFRENDDALPTYDGHHIALYVGKDSQGFKNIFKQVEQSGVVWVNPRFSDKATNLSGAIKWNQFRFKDILDLKTGSKVFTLEHEVRCVDHEAFPGKKSVIEK